MYRKIYLQLSFTRLLGKFLQCCFILTNLHNFLPSAFFSISSRSLINPWNSACHSTDPQGTSLLTSFCAESWPFIPSNSLLPTCLASFQAIAGFNYSLCGVFVVVVVGCWVSAFFYFLFRQTLMQDA